MKAPRSLKARALQLLAQRDQSPVELRRKLLSHAREMARRSDPISETREGGSGQPPASTSAVPEAMPVELASVDPPSVDPAVEVDAVLAWLAERRFLSVERFAESRVSARSPRFGNVRIRQELAQHGVALSPEADRALAASELERAQAVRARKFSAGPTDAKERARQARFLAARGFSAEVIGRVLREAEREADEAR
jgi:regulatory protein